MVLKSSTRRAVYLDVDNGLVRDIGFEGTDCAILLASASLTTLAVNGKTVEGARAVAERFMAMVTASFPRTGTASATWRRWPVYGTIRAG
jgi:NifU-like protein involved in Fe-S cluster formation